MAKKDESIEEVVETSTEELTTETSVEEVATETASAEELTVDTAPAEDDSKYATPQKVTQEDIDNYLPTPAGPEVVGLGVVDDIYLSSCVYKNEANRRSLSVYHVQRKLIELGLLKDGTVKGGYYGDLTKAAVFQYQQSKGIAGDGLMNAETLTALFEGDPNVSVNL